jgi:hypothetical protein
MYKTAMRTGDLASAGFDCASADGTIASSQGSPNATPAPFKAARRESVLLRGIIMARRLFFYLPVF